MFMIYGKMKNGNRFSPIDLKNGFFVNRKIYGSYFDTENVANRVVEDLNRNNPGMIFEYRKVK